MKIVMIGAGYVGLVSGVCFAELGFAVTCADIDAGKIGDLEAGRVPIYEPGLEMLLARGVEEGRLTFTTDIAGAVADADIVFIAVGTPSRHGDGEADLQYVFAALDTIIPALKGGVLVAVKSTVVVGTCRRIEETIRAARPDLDFAMASNPEFLREGAAIEDFMRPNRIVVGVSSKAAEETMRRLYRPLNLRETPLVVTTLENAELIKYAANAFLAMKVTFINEIANLCERIEQGDAQEIARGIGLDNRIGPKFLHPGPGFGGSCFPKDTRAFVAIGRKAGARQRLIEEVVSINEARKGEIAERIAAILRESGGDTVAVLGLAFKPETDDIREAASLTIVPQLQAAGLKVRAHDPEAMDSARQALGGVEWAEDPYHAADGADLIVILTEWNIYRTLDFAELRRRMRRPVMFDTRLIYRADELEGTGFLYKSVGRPDVDAR
ncbi:MAG: UDP-glucose/GDP-mannose dehydrogenase family protein [Flavobacteriaceae bacterium]